jgi:hypothetical protein
MRLVFIVSFASLLSDASDERSPSLLQNDPLSLVTPIQPHLEEWCALLRPLGLFFLQMVDFKHDEICCELLTIALSYPRNDVVRMSYTDLPALTCCNQAFEQYQV